MPARTPLNKLRTKIDACLAQELSDEDRAARLIDLIAASYRGLAVRSPIVKARIVVKWAPHTTDKLCELMVDLAEYNTLW
jgi:hypothetical protein